MKLFLPLIFLFFGNALARSYTPVFLIQSDSTDVNTIQKVPIRYAADTIFYLHGKAEAYPLDLRAAAINKNIAALEENFKPETDSLHLQEGSNFISIMHNQEALLAVTQADAAAANMPIKTLANTWLGLLDERIGKTEQLSTADWFKRIGLFLLSLAAIIAMIKIVNLIYNRLNKRLSKIERKFLNRKGNLLRYFLPGSSNNIFVFIVNILRIATVVVLIILCAPFLFHFFPFSENWVQKFYTYLEEPVMYVITGIINFIPSLFFIIIIGATARYFGRVVRAITADIEIGRLEIANFHKDWAKPTGKLVNLLIYALALVLIFPYLPGSGSSAFQGVSIFIGAIISFGSTSAIANIIAGVVITYMRPFQIGDRVKIDSIVGDVVDKTILVTHLSTSKNEDVTIPNANVLLSNIINYSSCKSGNIIVHTTVTLGYDVPWKQANALLLEAVKRAPHICETPEPFVLQTSLDDFYVSYELNAYTEAFKKLPFIYSEIHKHILDVFDEAGIEILSPGYTAARDGSPTTVPSQISPSTKGPIEKLVDHLTGRKQPIRVQKQTPDESSS